MDDSTNHQLGEELCEAVRNHENEKALALITAGANINHRSECLGITPIMAAIGALNIEMLEHLVHSQKVDYRIKDAHNRTPASFAKMIFQDSHSCIIELLEAREAEQIKIWGAWQPNAPKPPTHSL